MIKKLGEKISVIMPAYNESERIVFGIEETVKTFQDFGCRWELIVMDDGSSDDTYAKACGLIKKYPQNLIVKKTPLNIGKGGAIKEAFQCVSGAYAVFIDADLDLHPAQIENLFNIMELDNADVVIGSKLHPNSKVDYPLFRRMVSLLYYILVRLLFNLPCHDTQTGLKLFKAKVLQDVLPRIMIKKFAFDLEILVNAHHLGYKITEAPIVLISQRGYGRIGLEAVFKTLLDTLAVFYRLNILKYYDRVNPDCR